MPYDGSLGTLTLNQGENNYRKSKVIAFVVHAGVNIITNNFKICLCQKYLLYSTEVLLDMYWEICSANAGLIMMN